MKNLLLTGIVFLISLFGSITSTSQTISTTTSDTLITITPTQLKEINLIFNEHHTLLKEKEFLNKEISAQAETINDLEKISSLKSEQIFNCEVKCNNYKIDNEKLQKQLKKKKLEAAVCKFLAGGSLITAIVLLCLQ